MTSSDSLVVRSSVPAGKKYREYREDLRKDFFHQCAYCSMSEAEAQAIRMLIDHYEPRSVRPELEDVYSNLMWACDACNAFKGDICPPPSAREVGHRIFRIDQEAYTDHVELSGILLKPKTTTGEFSIDHLELNRQQLRRIRELRQRLRNCDRQVMEGVLAVRRFHIDQIPKNLRVKALKAIQGTVATEKDFADKLDEVLRQSARSELVDPDAEADARAAERASRMRQLQSLHPGLWRAPRKRQP